MAQIYYRNSTRRASRSRVWIARQARHINSVFAYQTETDPHAAGCTARLVAQSWTATMQFTSYADCAGFFSRTIFRHCRITIIPPIFDYDEPLIDALVDPPGRKGK